MNNDNVRRFVKYMNERYLIQERRALGAPWPWTTDPILQEWKFCNVRRELDRTTQWLLTNWYRPRRSDPQIGLACALARFVGYAPTLEAIGFPRKDWRGQYQRGLQRLIDKGEKAYTGAYMLKSDTRPKPQYTVEIVAEAWYEGLLKHGTPESTCTGLFDALIQLEGWGGFMAQEVVLDATYTAVLPLPVDRTSFAYAGPGAVRGLNRIHDREVKATLDKEQAYQEMVKLWGLLRASRGGLVDEVRATLVVHDVEFNLCEFDKYERVRLNEGAPRSRYRPPQEPSIAEKCK